MPHKPMMSESDAEKRLLHQNRCYNEHLKDEPSKFVDFHGLKLLVSQNVFAPEPWSWNLLARSVLMDVKETDRVLDMGTGSGVQAILAASKSTDVTAVDVNPFAVECAKMNVQSNGFSSRVKVAESNLFENVKGKFDLIIFDPPFRWTKPRDAWEKSCADEDYVTLQTFFAEVKKHLSTTGRIIMNFGTSGDIAYFKHLIRKNGFSRRQVLKSEENNQGWTYYTYKLTCDKVRNLVSSTSSQLS